MIFGKINLAKFKHAIKKGKTGQACIVIPIDDNKFFHSEKGNVFLDIVAFELREKEEGGDTHIISQSLPKEVREKMTEEEKNAQPIIGNLKVSSFDGEVNATPVSDTLEEDDDLPF